MSTKTKALLLVAMLCFAHAERDERMMKVNQKLQHILQAQPDRQPGALNEVAKIDENLSQTSRACSKHNLQGQVDSATSYLEKGKRFNSWDLVRLMTVFVGMMKSIRDGCKLSDLEAGSWDALKLTLQKLAPENLAGGEINVGSTDSELVANTFSLNLFGKLWKDQYPSLPIPALDVGVESTSEEDAVKDTKQTVDSLKPKFEQTDPWNIELSLLESGTNTSQLVSSKWNPIAFVGGIIVGLISLIVAVLCALLNVFNVVLVGGLLNGIFGSIYCLIKKAVQMKDVTNAEGFLPCMKTNAIAYVYKIAWRCNTACGFWALTTAKGSIEVAFDTKLGNKNQADPQPPDACIKK